MRVRFPCLLRRLPFSFKNPPWKLISLFYDITNLKSSPQGRHCRLIARKKTSTADALQKNKNKKTPTAIEGFRDGFERK